MGIITSRFGNKIGVFHPRAYWAARLRSGIGKDDYWLSEIDNRQFFLGKHAAPRTYDWTLDLVATGDLLRIKELWMICPPGEVSPKGNTATLYFDSKGGEAGMAFHFNVAIMTQGGRVDHKVIGKVTDRATGDCECFVWDDEIKGMSAVYKTNVNNFASWRPGVAPIGRLSHEVVGLRGVAENFYRP
jgi:hypothetical protein